MMDKKVASLMSAAAGIATMAAAVPASAAPALEPATSYAELIAPILNAAVILRADDAKRAEQASAAIKTDSRPPAAAKTSPMTAQKTTCSPERPCLHSGGDVQRRAHFWISFLPEDERKTACIGIQKEN